jgi:RNA polymerase sigma-70 factor, ECF subfamily
MRLRTRKPSKLDSCRLHFCLLHFGVASPDIVVLLWSIMEDIHQHRPLLFSLAYNIIGEVQEAEDIVQDVFESWFAKQPEVQFPKAYLSRAVVNKSIDRLESLKKAREVYKGPWLPVPIVAEVSAHGEKQAGDPLPYALVSLLEKLNPLERAAFILRHAFDFPYSDISQMCNVPEENARQLVHRAQEKLQKPRVRYEASVEERQRLLDAFLDACVREDTATLKEILHRDVVMYTDGGGRVNAAIVPVVGPEKIINFLTNVLKDAVNRFELKPVIINGSAGALVIDKATGRTDTICTLETDGQSITNLYFVRNPEKIFF